MLRFCALRFIADENLCDRLYWYLSGFPVRTGDRVLAPVGPNDRLQLAVVERTEEADEENAPYPLSLVKRTAAPFGARRLSLPSGGEFLELGGVRYDDRHYTRFKVFLSRPEPPSAEEKGSLFGYGAKKCFVLPSPAAREFDELFFRALTCRDCALLCGEGAREASARILLFSGVPKERVLPRGERSPFPLPGEETLRLFRKKFC